MENLRNILFQSDRFQEIGNRLHSLQPSDTMRIKGVAGSLFAFIVTYIFDNPRRQILIISPDEDKAEKLRDDCALLIGRQNVRFFSSLPVLESQTLDITSSIAQIETLKSLSAGEPLIAVATPAAVVKKIPAPEQFRQTIIQLDTHSEYNFQELLEKLDQLGFERKNFVESYGDVAVRGGIVDVFPFVGEHPLRFEFWGNTIESIREFDVLSQRSIRELESASIVPDVNQQDLERPSTAHSSIFDYLRTDALIFLDEPEFIQREIEELNNEAGRNIFTFDEIQSMYSKYPCIVSTNFGEPDIHNSESSVPIIDFHSTPQPALHGNINLLIDHLAKLEEQGYTIYLSSDTKEETERLKELIDEAITAPETGSAGPRHYGTHPTSHIINQSPSIHPVFITDTVHSGFIHQPARIAVFTEHEIFGRLKRRDIVKRRRFKGFTHKEMQQLKRGDHVVHVDYGIGTFIGLTKIRVGTTEQEVMKLVFLEDDVLYVNLNFINRVQKYSSQEGHVPKLNKLGAVEWEKAKARAKKRIKDIARDLIALYARRKQEHGTAFSADTHWQKELEASFMYEDTVDQATATLDVKRDMEHPSPMDRLICGDVGFGKTEVAVRAAFKAVMEGKQVAVLVPTTILAIQHYNTFLDRLHRYTTRVDNITRFKTKKDQQRIVDELKSGSLDIVIGTHRLLSKDIGFKDLGLLIIDEEHRFGVSAKEKLRQFKAAVDTLALTATPIPRTLHFSLIGARDLSVIATPPRNRLPIITEIIPGSESKRTQWQIVREAIIKELHRGGQIYFVHDRVQNIEAIADQLKFHVPEARVHIAHGQMTGHQLEKTMLDFLEKKYDILVCTKIIESGLDIPNVNTIVINRADRFGLAELYQLRGRVGRSNVQAYAYLLVPPITVLPKQTLRRLQAIEEFTELGSGFNLAMRDLEIRGAGNLLGAEQSGFIMEMGFEMYERIVREAVDELKQEEFKETFQDSGSKSQDRHALEPLAVKRETIIDADIEALIPDFYIEAQTERLDIYRRLYRATIDEELKLMREELHDRFGEYPEEVENLFRLVELRVLGSQGGFPKITIEDNLLVLSLPPETDEQFYGKVGDTQSPFQKIMRDISEKRLTDVQLKQAGKELELRFTIQTSGDRIRSAKQLLEKLKSYSSL
jgi:transcription-repair coupling factor (superfamily II helicase)